MMHQKKHFFLDIWSKRLLRPLTLYYFILYLYNWSKNSLVYDSRSKTALSRSRTWIGTVFKGVEKQIISYLLYLILYDSSLPYGCSWWFYVSICVLSWWGIMQKCLFTTPCFTVHWYRYATPCFVIPGQEYKRHGKHGCMTYISSHYSFKKVTQVLYEYEISRKTH